MDKKCGMKGERGENDRLTERWWRDHSLRVRLGKGRGLREWRKGEERIGKQLIKEGFVCKGFCIVPAFLRGRGTSRRS